MAECTDVIHKARDVMSEFIVAAAMFPDIAAAAADRLYCNRETAISGGTRFDGSLQDAVDACVKRLIVSTNEQYICRRSFFLNDCELMTQSDATGRDVAEATLGIVAGAIVFGVLGSLAIKAPSSPPGSGGGYGGGISDITSPPAGFFGPFSNGVDQGS